MSIDRFADENGRLVVGDEMRDYLDHVSDRQYPTHQTPPCPAELGGVQCGLLLGHEGHHQGKRPDGAISWSDK